MNYEKTCWWNNEPYECCMCGFDDTGCLVIAGVGDLTDKIYCINCYEVLKTCPDGSLAIWEEVIL